MQFGVFTVVYVDRLVVVVVSNVAVALVAWAVVGPCCVPQPEMFSPEVYLRSF